MSIDQLRTKVSDVISGESCSAEYYFLLEHNNQISIKRADIEQAAADELAQNFIDAISTNILVNDELSLLNISSADDRTNAIYRYDLPQIPHQIQLLATILEQDNFETFDFNSDDLAHLEGILIILGHGEHQLALYKYQYPVALLKHDNGFSLARRKNQNRLAKLDGDILRINSKFEFMRINNEYYIVDIKTLERFFGFHDAIRAVATRGIANIDQAELVVDVSVLSERLDDISFSRKLVRAANGSPVLGVIPNADVIAFVTSHPALRGKLRISEDGSKLKLDTKVSQNLFLKLLNDDFLQSELTKRYYASLAKDALDAATTP